MKEASSGRWQRRWFEIVSHYLVYYKTKDDVKMLCAMDLWLVGEGEWAPVIGTNLWMCVFV